MIYYIILIFIIIVLGWIVWKSYWHNEADRKEILAVTRERDEYVDLGKGLAEFNQKVEERRDAAKLKILKMFEVSSKLSHKDVAKEIGTSRTTTKRYLDELEAEGKIKQVGKAGQSVFYTKI